MKIIKILVCCIFLVSCSVTNSKIQQKAIKNDNLLYYNSPENSNKNQLFVSSISNEEKFEIKNDKIKDILFSKYNSFDDTISLVSRTGCIVTKIKRNTSFKNLDICKKSDKIYKTAEVTTLVTNKKGDSAYLLNGGYGTKNNMYNNAILVTNKKGKKNIFLKFTKYIVNIMLTDHDIYYILDPESDMMYNKGSIIRKYNLKSKKNDTINFKLKRNESIQNIIEYNNSIAVILNDENKTYITDLNRKRLLQSNDNFSIDSQPIIINKEKVFNLIYEFKDDSYKDAILVENNNKLGIETFNKSCINQKPFINTDGVYCVTKDKKILYDNLKGDFKTLNLTKNKELGYYGTGYAFFRIK